MFHAREEPFRLHRSTLRPLLKTLRFLTVLFRSVVSQRLYSTLILQMGSGFPGKFVPIYRLGAHVHIAWQKRSMFLDI